MKWNIFILVFVWNQTIGLPFEICCADDQREDDSFVLDAPEQAELYDNVPEEEEEEDKKSLFNSFQQVVIPAVDLVGGCDERCCRRQGFHNSWDKKDSESQLVRTKRFPWHLDPLYQYRYLARSGQCPTAKDGQAEFYCPTPDKLGNWRCIDDFQLCDGVRHCPNGEDELPVSCLFYRVIETHLNSVSQLLNNDEMRQRTRASSRIKPSTKLA